MDTDVRMDTFINYEYSNQFRSSQDSGTDLGYSMRYFRILSKRDGSVAGGGEGFGRGAESGHASFACGLGF